MTDSQGPKIKILLVTHYYPAHRGGVEIVAGKIAEGLLASGSVSLKWMASNTDTAPQYGENFEAVPAAAWNITEKILGIPFPFWSFGSLKRLWNLVREADAVHLHDYLYMGNQKAFWFAKLQKKPVVITQHIGKIPYRNPVFRLFLDFLNLTFGKIMLAHCDQAVFISESVKAYFSENVSFLRPALMVPNGVDGGIFNDGPETERDQLRKKLGWKDEIVFLFAGRFVEKKGLNVLRELVRRFPQARWCFAGWGPEDPGKWNEKNVTVYRDRSGETLAELYHAADLLVLPSRGEGFPLVVQEAMACGLPVMLGTETLLACPAAAPLILHAPAEKSDEETAALWTENLKEIFQNPKHIEALRPQMAVFAQENWSWERCLALYMEIFQKTVPGKA